MSTKLSACSFSPHSYLCMTNTLVTRVLYHTTLDYFMVVIKEHILLLVDNKYQDNVGMTHVKIITFQEDSNNHSQFLLNFLLSCIKLCYI